MTSASAADTCPPMYVSATPNAAEIESTYCAQSPPPSLPYNQQILHPSLRVTELYLYESTATPVLALGNVTTETEMETEAPALMPVKRKPEWLKGLRNKHMVSVQPSTPSTSTRREGRTFIEVEGLALAKALVNQSRMGPNQDAKCMWKPISEYWEMDVKMVPWTPGYLRVKWPRLQRDVKYIFGVRKVGNGYTSKPVDSAIHRRARAEALLYTGWGKGRKAKMSIVYRPS